ncbi:choice-of-anchor C family protein [Qipengyuania sediminis]|uniref:choice-of-anchor C family protein n=1 Tax=Qipengyuania sediminis TaxID=1532023 RepID=UPI00105977FC|nr:choice-of-anchor C family protein [Qipengyuania sediminis]
MRILPLIGGVMLAASAVPASAATITNGSFELGPEPGSFVTLGTGSTAITGWTVTAGTIDYIGTYWTAQNGSRSIDLAGNSPGAISQTFATIVGQRYDITYWIGRNPDGGLNPRTGFIDVGGGQSQFLYTGSGDRANMQWQRQVFSFNATSANTTLTFAADPRTAGQSFGPALDNVSITAVPEPGAWAFLILGFGLVGGALRRSKPRRVALQFG